MSFDLDSIKDINLHLPEINNLSNREANNIVESCNLVVDYFSSGNVNSNLSFNKHCVDLESIYKDIASQNNIEKIVEAESLLVGMASQIEDSRDYSRAHIKNVENFIKQADALSSILKFCDFFKSYNNYEIVMGTSPKGVKNCEKYGLPEDNVYHCLNSNISSLRATIQSNTGPAEFDNLTDTRIKVLNRAKILYMQRQIPFMIEFADKNPDNTLAYAFSLNRVGIEKNIQTLLDKSDEVLGMQKAQEKTQTQTQQTQDPASNKKTKSPPDIEL